MKGVGMLVVSLMGCSGRNAIIDKTRQDNVLFGVLYSPMYIDFICQGLV